MEAKLSSMAEGANEANAGVQLTLAPEEGLAIYGTSSEEASPSNTPDTDLAPHADASFSDKDLGKPALDDTERSASPALDDAERSASPELGQVAPEFLDHSPVIDPISDKEAGQSRAENFSDLCASSQEASDRESPYGEKDDSSSKNAKSENHTLASLDPSLLLDKVADTCEEESSADERSRGHSCSPIPRSPHGAGAVEQMMRNESLGPPDSLEVRLLEAQRGLESRLVAHFEGIEATLNQMVRSLKAPGIDSNRKASCTSVHGTWHSVANDEGAQPPSRRNSHESPRWRRSMDRNPWDSHASSRRSSAAKGSCLKSSFIDSSSRRGSQDESMSRQSTVAGHGANMVSRQSSDGSSFGHSNSFGVANSTGLSGLGLPLSLAGVGSSGVQAPQPIPENSIEARFTDDFETDADLVDQGNGDPVVRCKSFTNLLGLQQKQSRLGLQSPRNRGSMSGPLNLGSEDPNNEAGRNSSGGTATTASFAGSEDPDSIGGSITVEDSKSGVSRNSVGRLKKAGVKLCDTFFPRVHPNSSKRTMFDVASMVVLFYDSTMIPYQLAWDVEADQVFLITSWAMLIFWMFDMFMSFSTGYYSSGELEMRREAISRRYLRTWFVFDFTVNFGDLLGMVLQSVDQEGVNKDSMKVLRMFKANRLLRILALLRLVRISRRMDGLRSRILPDNLYLLTQMGKLFFLVLWLNHVATCVWYGLARHRFTDTGTSWLEPFEMTLDGSTQTATYEYLTAYHWSMSQMTPGSMEVVPTNSWERAWTIICLFFSLFLSVSLVSQLSAKMVKHNMSHLERTKNMKIFRRFLLENKIRADLCIRCQQQIEERLALTQRLAARDVSAISLLSPAIRAELMCSAWSPNLLHNQLFFTWAQLDGAFMKDLAVNAVELLSLAQDDELFVAQTTGDTIYLSLHGDLQYIQEYDEFNKLTVPVEVRTWISEAALWIYDWMHRGTMRAAKSSNVMTVSSSGFLFALRRHRTVTKLAREYSKALSHLLQSHGTDLLTDLTLGIEFAELLLSMPHQSRELMTKHIIDDMRQKYTWTGWAFGSPDVDAIETEVQTGQCALVMEPNGVPVRVVLPVVVKVTRSDGRVLAQVEKDVNLRHEYPSWGTFRLPGTRKQDQEHPRETFDRLLDGELSFLAENLELLCDEYDVAWHDVPGAGIRTKFMRTTYYAKLSDETEVVAPQTRNQRTSVTSARSANSPEFLATCDAGTHTDANGNTVNFVWLNVEEYEQCFQTVATGTNMQNFWAKTSSVLPGQVTKVGSMLSVSSKKSGAGWFRNPFGKKQTPVDTMGIVYESWVDE